MDLRFLSASDLPPSVPDLLEHLLATAPFETVRRDDEGHEWMLRLTVDDEDLLKMWGSTLNAGAITVGRPAAHVTGPLPRNPSPDDVERVERRRLDLRASCGTAVDADGAAQILRIVTGLLDDFALAVCDEWGHLVPRSDVEDLFLTDVDDTRSQIEQNRALRQIRIWSYAGELFGVPCHPTDWFLIDGDEVLNQPLAEDAALGAFVRDVVRTIRVDLENPDYSQRFPDGEKAVIRAAGARTKTAFHEDARLVGIDVQGDRWLLQPFQNRGPRRAWHANQETDGPVELHAPTDSDLGAALLRALRHFDDREPAPTRRRR